MSWEVLDGSLFETLDLVEGIELFGGGIVEG